MHLGSTDWSQCAVREEEKEKGAISVSEARRRERQGTARGYD